VSNRVAAASAWPPLLAADVALATPSVANATTAAVVGGELRSAAALLAPTMG
jgi:hypothetical protein